MSEYTKYYASYAKFLQDFGIESTAVQSFCLAFFSSSTIGKQSEYLEKALLMAQNNDGKRVQALHFIESYRSA